jgi:glycosyltransferase involved in cell wall biosynthesis
MQQRLSLPADKVHVVRIGIDPQDYPPTKPREGVAIVGFLSRLTPALGVETLLDAFIQLRAEPGRENLRLSAVGGIAGDDARFLRHLRQKAAKAGLADAVSFSGDVDGPARRRFLASLSLLCVPMAQGEAYGTFLLEGWAARVPAVMPAAGAFPELIEVTGGGLLYDPADPEALPSALRRLLDDPLHAAAMGRKGREAVEGTLSLSTMADATVQVYQAVTRRHP